MNIAATIDDARRAFASGYQVPILSRDGYDYVGGLDFVPAR